MTYYPTAGIDPTVNGFDLSDLSDPEPRDYFILEGSHEGTSRYERGNHNTANVFGEDVRAIPFLTPWHASQGEIPPDHPLMVINPVGYTVGRYSGHTDEAIEVTDPSGSVFPAQRALPITHEWYRSHLTQQQEGTETLSESLPHVTLPERPRGGGMPVNREGGRFRALLPGTNTITDAHVLSNGTIIAQGAPWWDALELNPTLPRGSWVLAWTGSIWSVGPLNNDVHEGDTHATIDWRRITHYEGIGSPSAMFERWVSIDRTLPSGTFRWNPRTGARWVDGTRAAANSTDPMWRFVPQVEPASGETQETTVDHDDPVTTADHGDPAPREARMQALRARQQGTAEKVSVFLSNLSTVADDEGWCPQFEATLGHIDLEVERDTEWDFQVRLTVEYEVSYNDSPSYLDSAITDMLEADSLEDFSLTVTYSRVVSVRATCTDPAEWAPSTSELEELISDYGDAVSGNIDDFEVLDYERAN